MLNSLVVGNGESRAGIDLTSFKNDYTLIGCNAIHRDMPVDHLVCCDRRMVEEAVKSKNTLDTSIHVRPDWYRYFRKIRKDKRIHQVPDLPYNGTLKQDQPLHWGSGTYAVLLGAMLSDVIILTGFDLYSNTGKVNNIYKDTENYLSSDKNSIDPSYWIYQTSKIFEAFPSRDFIIINDKNWQVPKEWKFKNVTFEEISK